MLLKTNIANDLCVVSGPRNDQAHPEKDVVALLKELLLHDVALMDQRANVPIKDRHMWLAARYLLTAHVAAHPFENTVKLVEEVRALGGVFSNSHKRWMETTLQLKLKPKP